MRRIAVAFVLAGMALMSTPSQAYVRTRTRATGTPTAWKSPCVTMELALGAFPAQLDAAGYLNAAQQGAAAWTFAALDGINRCSNVDLSVVASPEATGPVGDDDHNRIVFRQDRWCRDPSATDPKKAQCHDPSALAITTVFQMKESGEIVDADIEVNAVTYTWGNFVPRPDSVPFRAHDFQGAITHELGHVLGLEHTCYIWGTYEDGTVIPRPVDNLGNPIPDCSPSNPALISDATMYVSVSSPETEVGLRSLSPDDVQGVCDIYAFSPSFVCGAPTSDPSSGGCSLGGPHGPGAIAGVLAAIVLGLRLRRRRRG